MMHAIREMKCTFKYFVAVKLNFIQRICRKMLRYALYTGFQYEFEIGFDPRGLQLSGTWQQMKEKRTRAGTRNEAIIIIKQKLNAYIHYIGVRFCVSAAKCLFSF